MKGRISPRNLSPTIFNNTWKVLILLLMVLSVLFVLDILIYKIQGRPIYAFISIPVLLPYFLFQEEVQLLI